LYGTEQTQEEIEQDAELAYKKSAIESDESDAGVRFHDDMDIAELGDDVVEEIQETEQANENLSSTEIARQAASDQKEAPAVDDAIFEVFLEESVEVLDEANIQYEICKADLNDRNAIRELRRAFHTLKGSARMVGLEDVAEVAWLSESLFNYVLDTEKPLSPGTLSFARDALDEFQTQLDDRYANQHLIDTAEWGVKAERVNSPDVAEIDVAEIDVAEIDVEEIDAVELDEPAQEVVEPVVEEEVELVDDEEVEQEIEPVVEEEVELPMRF